MWPCPFFCTNYSESFADFNEGKALVEVWGATTDNKFSKDQVDYEYPYQLVSKGNAKGKALWKINPDYFNTSLPMTKVQVLIIDEHASNFCPPFLKQRLDSWFNQIDYKKLNELISK